MEGRCPLPLPGDRLALARAPNTNENRDARDAHPGQAALYNPRRPCQCASAPLRCQKRRFAG